MLPARRSSRTTKTARRNAPPLPKTERIDMRVTQSQRELLAEASRATQTTVTDFVLNAATDAAEQVLADRTEFWLPEDQWSLFVRALDAPARPLPRLRRLLEAPTVLDEG